MVEYECQGEIQNKARPPDEVVKIEDTEEKVQRAAESDVVKVYTHSAPEAAIQQAAMIQPRFGSI